MASGNPEGFAKLRQHYGPTMWEACKRIYNEHPDDELLACLHQIAAKNQALKKAAGRPIPSVDPEELKSRWNDKERRSCSAVKPSAISQEEREKSAAIRRHGMIRILVHFNHGQLLVPWQHGADLDDAVFRIAADAVVAHRVYKLGGEDIFGFDPNTCPAVDRGEWHLPHMK